MRSLFWHFVSRTPETEFIFALFHLLLACLTLLVLFSSSRRTRSDLEPPPRRLLIASFWIFALEFGMSTGYFGSEFFFGKSGFRAEFMEISQALDGAARVLASAGLLVSLNALLFRRALRVAVAGCSLAGVFLLSDLILPAGTAIDGIAFHTAAMVATDLIALAAVGVAAYLLIRGSGRAAAAPAVALVLFFAAALIHLFHLFWGSPWSAAVWHMEQHLVSFALVAFAWALGERSANLFDRVFVRLNLTFILLASVMILSTIGMERFQYVRITEERSLNLAEFLRGHLTYYGGKGENLATILAHPEVLRRIVVGFGELPDFRRLEIFLGNQHVIWRYAADKTVSQEIVAAPAAPLREIDLPDSDENMPAGSSFRMIGLPVSAGSNATGRIEFHGGMEHLNRYLGNYIIVVYLLFTVMVGASIIVVGIIVSNADRAIQKQHADIEGIERQLAQAAKLASIGELAGGVAHEINNPVTGILSMATHLLGKRRDASLPQRDREDLELIASQAERISGTVSKLLAFSRQSRMEIAAAGINEIVESAISLIQFRLRGTRVTLKRELAKGAPEVLCDQNRLTEVFVNLMNNAIDAMPSGGVLSVRTAMVHGRELWVQVSDTGCGIDNDVIGRIFDPFFTTKEPGKGTGLGLSISHGVVRGHGGEIQVASAPGQGSTFTVILPIGVTSNGETNPGRG